MRLKKIDILKNAFKADAICFTSNGVVKKDGSLVMGAGVAKAFKNTIPGLAQKAGSLVQEYGNYCQYIMDWNGTAILNYPTKHHWKDSSDIQLIKESANHLCHLTNDYGWGTVFVPAPGCGLGGLSFDKDVEPVLRNILDDRFIICSI